MTLLIGILCNNGVVIAADSLATMGEPLGNSTTTQPTVSKITIHAKRVIIGTAGQVGMSQLILDQLEGRWSEHILNKKLKLTAADARQKISRFMWLAMKEPVKRAEAMSKVIGGQAAFHAIASLTLIALPLQDRPLLCTFGYQTESEQCTHELPFVSMGSGQKDADTFLAFLRRVLWEDGIPDRIGEGIFAALWTMNHVITVNPSGTVGGTPKIAVLEKSGDEWTARELPEDEMLEHRQAIDGAEGKIRGYLKELQPEGDR